MYYTFLKNIPIKWKTKTKRKLYSIFLENIYRHNVNIAGLSFACQNLWGKKIMIDHGQNKC